MDSNINKFEDIEIPASADIAIEKGIRMGERHNRFRRNTAIISTAAAIFIAIMVSGFVSPTMANVLVKVPVVGSIFENSVDKGLKNISEKGLSNPQNMEITSNGITVSIKEVYYDKSSISVGYVVAGKDIGSRFFNLFFYCNGKMIQGGGTGDTNSLSKDAYSGITTLFTGGNLPENFDLRIVASENLDKKSPYDFTIPVSRSKVDSQSREITIMKYLKSDNKVLLVKKASLTPASTIINFEYTRQKWQKEIQLQIKDENGIWIGTNSLGGGTEEKGENLTDIFIAIFNPYKKLPQKIDLRALEDNKPIMEMEFNVQ
jgi:hypothetical protein